MTPPTARIRRVAIPCSPFGFARTAALILALTGCAAPQPDAPGPLRSPEGNPVDAPLPERHAFDRDVRLLVPGLDGVIDLMATEGNAPLYCALRRGGELHCWLGPAMCHPEELLCNCCKLPMLDERCDAPDVPAVALPTGSASKLLGGCVIDGDGGVACMDSYASLEQRPQIRGAVELVGTPHNGCARSGDGRVWCWRSRANDTVQVREMTTLADTVELSGRLQLRCARSRGGQVRCWNTNPYVDEEPRLIPEIDDAIDIDVDAHLCVVRRGGTLACGGFSTRKPFPVETIAGINDAVEVLTRYDDQCVRTRAGGVRCIGRTYPGPDVYELVEVAGARDVAALELRVELPCARTRAGEVLCWQPSKLEPPQAHRVPELVGSRASAGRCIVDADGRVTCWGPARQCLLIF